MNYKLRLIEALANAMIADGVPSYQQLLFYVAAMFKPNVMVELGVYRGQTTIQLAEGNPEGQVYGVDLRMDNVKQARIHRRYNITLVEEDSLKAVDQIPPADLIFFDSLHRYNHLMAEYEVYSAKARPGCLLFFDDIEKCNEPGIGDFTEEMKQAWEDIPIEKILLPNMNEFHGFGVAVVE